MPDFDGWSYPDDAVGGYEAFRTKVRAIEKPFDQKIHKAVWRGSVAVNHKLRSTLIEVAENKTWSDVENVRWMTRTGVMEMQDFCAYQYVIQTEGRDSLWGLSPFHILCAMYNEQVTDWFRQVIHGLVA